ncbi:MAG: hypothetical protein L0215_22885, partial [Gemmataceae bacterium]|nr:hypothetical protein [Gemmataceae bacterium]
RAKNPRRDRLPLFISPPESENASDLDMIVDSRKRKLKGKNRRLDEFRGCVIGRSCLKIKH